jgi:hypothetical protein
VDNVDVNPLVAEQSRRNRVRAGEWELSAGHRRHLTDRIVALAPSSAGRLCVLGAGNVNDLDLVTLCDSFREIHLVDIDGEALARGVRRQIPASQAGVPLHSVSMHGGIDVTGIWRKLVEYSQVADGQSPLWDELAVQALEPGTFGLPAPFDVVVSAGMLSQLVEAVVRTVPQDAPRYWDLLLAVRTGHLRMAVRLATPGGHTLISSDFVSSATCPELDCVAERDLPALAHRLAQDRNFFHGLNPLHFQQLFTADSALCQLVAEVHHVGYWLWRQRARTYAVMALDCRRGSR